jgi:hypothetical protein
MISMILVNENEEASSSTTKMKSYREILDKDLHRR